MVAKIASKAGGKTDAQGASPRAKSRGLRVLGVILASAALLAVSLPSAFAQAQEDLRTPIQTEIRIPVPAPDQVPGSTLERRLDYLTAGKVEDLAQYIGIIYNFLISIVGLVAAVVVIVGGFQYLTSAGDSARIGAAKSRMANAFIGLVLALGAYTILNTINPALLAFSVPDFRQVKTVIFTLPWCEDIEKGDPSKNQPPRTVTPFGSGTTCGFAGKYRQGNSDQPCIYAGSCRALRISEDTVDVGETPDDEEKNGMYKTCVQRSGVESETVLAELANNPNAKFAECLYCADMTDAKAKSLGFTIEAACQAWTNAFDSVPAAIKDAAANARSNRNDIKNGFFHVCYPRTIPGSHPMIEEMMKKEAAGDPQKLAKVQEIIEGLKRSPGCMGAPIFCYEVNRNEDCTACGERETNGCEGYDEEPSPSFARSLDDKGFAKPRYTYDEDGMEEYPVHLGTLCAQNPCRDFIDPVTGKQSFINGCKSGNGIVFAAQRIVRHGDIGAIDDCRNN